MLKLIGFWLIFAYSASDQFIGLGTINFTRFEKCAPDVEGLTLNVSLCRMNRTHSAINAYLVITPSIEDDSIEMNVTVEKWSDGGWKPYPFNLYDDKPCEFFARYFKDELTDFLRLNNKPIKCPLTSGTYSLKNYVLTGNSRNSLIHGEFRADIIFMKDSEVLTCLQPYVINTPRRIF